MKNRRSTQGDVSQRLAAFPWDLSVRVCSVRRRRGVGRSNVVAVKRRMSGFPSAAANCAPSLRGRETATPQSNQRDPPARQRDTHSRHSKCVNVTRITPRVQPPSCSPNRGRKKSGPPCSAAHVSAFSAAPARARQDGTQWMTQFLMCALPTHKK